MASRLAVAAALLCLLSCVKSLTVDKSDGGYKDLLISIHKDVPYNETIVENIKSLLRSSSDFLHRATNGRVYFKHVMINFPNTWPKRSSARSVSSSWFDKSDVRVDLSGSTAEERPFTKQSRLCGERGDYIKLTPTFVAELNASTARTFRNPAYVFVHEWAHYRYGVFDEHGWLDDEKYPRTYCEDGKVKLNACSTKFRFIPKMASGEICTKLNKTSCRFPKDCVIHVYTSVKDPVESSIMFMPYVANVSQFCDSGKGSRQHNRFAPNKHNAMCKGKSTWEVISENEDFKNLPRPDISKRIEVSFDETQQREDLPQRIVLVLDVSASMDDFQRMTVLKRAATQYTQDIENGSKRLAIITFSSNATVRHPLTTVNDGTRQGFLDSINELEPDTSTCIGCGLLRALEILTTEDETPEGSIIVLISDGIENRDPRLKDVLLQLTAAKVEVSTMALGTEADDQLEMLATVTRGKAFSFQDVQGNRALRMQAAFVEATTTHSGTDNDYVTLTDTARNFTTRLDEKLVLEPSLGNDTIVLVELVKPMQADITVTLIDPSGQKCEQCSEHRDEKTRKIIIPSPAQPGEWTIQVESPEPGPVEVNIQAKSKGKDPNSEPIQVACRVASLEVGKPDEAIIYVDVNKGRKAVLDATVFAEVTGPNEPYKSTVQLHDDGRDADVQANDGTYSGYFDEFTGKGRYAVTAHVSGDNETRVSGPKIASGGGNTMLPLPSEDPAPPPPEGFLPFTWSSTASVIGLL
nr:calcium-activated chloride channel regulator 1-like [Rhipicephalus microplus]